MKVYDAEIESEKFDNCARTKNDNKEIEWGEFTRASILLEL